MDARDLTTSPDPDEDLIASILEGPGTVEPNIERTAKQVAQRLEVVSVPRAVKVEDLLGLGVEGLARGGVCDDPERAGLGLSGHRLPPMP